jgi:hypothetical protein
MDEHQERLVLHNDVTHEDFVKVAESDLGLIQYETHPSVGGSKMFEDVWVTADKTTKVGFVDYETMACCYLWISGAQIPKIFSKLYKLLHSDDGEDLIESLESAIDHDKVFYTILKIGVAYPHYDPQAFEVYKHYIQHPYASLRAATLKAIAFGLWCECRPLVEKEAQTETDEQIAEFAQRLFEKYQE